MPETSIPKQRLLQIFQFLEAFHQVRNPVVRQLRDQPWSFDLTKLPDHESIRLGSRSHAKGKSPEEGDEDVVLRIERPRFTPAPDPPESLRAWVIAGWQEYPGRAEVRETLNEWTQKGGTVTVAFEESAARVRALGQWRAQREAWLRAERPAREAARVFEAIYELHSRLLRESEKVELVLGDGHLNWRQKAGGVDHPLLLVRVSIDFDPQVPAFTIRETDAAPELYSGVFRTLEGVDPRVVGALRQQLQDGGYHPLEKEATSTYLRGMAVQLSPKGEFLGEAAAAGEQDHPRIRRGPVLFLRDRSLGFATALEAIIKALQTTDPELPPSLIGVTGFAPPVPTEIIEPTGSWKADGNHDTEVLFSKPANVEQLQIAKRLTEHGSVLVQGPPGTGKTHTIANLIGHLLAQGKSVLVTAHTSKALNEVRAKVVPSLQPLCVSVLGRDAANQDERERSVTGIVDRLSTTNAEALEARARSERAERERILSELGQAQATLLAARTSEYTPIVIGGTSRLPSEAARVVAAGKSRHDWIPAPVTSGAVCPLSEEEVLELYRTNVSVSREDEKALAATLPHPSELLLPSAFAEMATKINDLVTRPKRWPVSLWHNDVSSRDQLNAIKIATRRATEAVRPGRDWLLGVMEAGRKGGASRETWETLLREIAETHSAVETAREHTLRHEIKFHPTLDRRQQMSIVQQIIEDGPERLNFGFFGRLAHREWADFVGGLRIDGKPPADKAALRIVSAALNVAEAREKLVARWDRQVRPLGGPAIVIDGTPPEAAALQLSEELHQALSWADAHAKPVQTALSTGFDWNSFAASYPTDYSANAPTQTLLRALGDLPHVIDERLAEFDLQELRSEIARLSKHLESKESGGEGAADLVKALRASVLSLNDAAYRDAFERLTALHNRNHDLSRRRELLLRLDAHAPGWAAAIRQREAPHGGAAPPGRTGPAWDWIQFETELDRRAQISIVETQRRIENLERTLREVTARLIDAAAWAAQLKRTKFEQRQSLIGWAQIVKKIGKGTGKRVPKLQAEARKLMAASQSAVPVWIMPLAQVVENFDAATTKFDVVIIDEASQADAKAMIALYMGRQVVVVGDHKQVSPDAVGQDVLEVDHLIEEHLAGIPNAKLYDGQQSIYDIAMQSFGGIICLKEHFRCVPEIIEFSNHLSYDGTIKPLRDASNVKVRPHVVEHRVVAKAAADKKNRDEAEEIAALIAAAIEMPEYAENEEGEPTSFGVISLVGDEQALEIERLLRAKLSPAAYSRHQILCGNPAQFQGAERDVVFLSMVDTPGDGPLRMRQEPSFQKRYNVAASRARNQMWVVHSLNPGIDLKSGDLRRRLIEHAQAPMALTARIARAAKHADSEFEKLVGARLIERGFHLTPQWQVGHYFIDLVVSDGQNRLAIECDGDKYHPVEKIAEDMERQAILERLGWRFERIRGSTFFRDPERAMERVFERLRAMHIQPQSASSQETPTRSQTIEAVIRRAQEARSSTKSLSD